MEEGCGYFVTPFYFYIVVVDDFFVALCCHYPFEVWLEEDWLGRNGITELAVE